jgi:uncharacterized protein
MRVGLISDTHGLLRPEAVQALSGSDLIIHGGDVGKPEILDELKKLAPVYAVRGNIDRGNWAKLLPETAAMEAGPVRIFVQHIRNEIDIDPAQAGFHVVVTGHSHQPGSEMTDGVLYVNPGSAGPRRFRLPITVAQLDLSVSPWDLRFITLVEK